MVDQGMRDVVLYSRVRLARNFADIPFPAKMTGEDGDVTQQRAAEALAKVPEGNEYAMMRVHDMPETKRRSLMEQSLISRELLSSGAYAAVLLRNDAHVSIMINEEDHLRIHALLPGFQLEAAAEMAFVVDEAVGKEVTYAYDAEFGYLTTCPTNAGTGMRVSALLHLPALNRTNRIGGLVQELVKLGVSLRPAYSEEGSAQGDLFLVGNQVSMGRSEQELLESVEAVVSEMVERERRAREMLLLESDARLEDRLMRSIGILRNARLLTASEWMRRWSDARLAVQAGWLQMDLSDLDTLLNEAKPAHMEERAGRELSPAERDEVRATLVREAFQLVPT